MRRLFMFALAGALLAGAAHADPCKAIPDRGPLPAYLYPGAEFSGPVVYVGDGDSLCVDVGAHRWVEVRLEDFYASELHEPDGRMAKRRLEAVALGRNAVCTADHRSYDRIVARCRVGGVSIGDRLRSAGEREGGRGRKGAQVR